MLKIRDTTSPRSAGQSACAGCRCSTARSPVRSTAATVRVALSTAPSEVGHPLAQRSRDAQHVRLAGLDVTRVSSEAQPPCGDRGIRHVLDATPAGAQARDPLRVHVEPDDADAGLSEGYRQGEAHVPQSDDTGAGGSHRRRVTNRRVRSLTFPQEFENLPGVRNRIFGAWAARYPGRAVTCGRPSAVPSSPSSAGR